MRRWNGKKKDGIFVGILFHALKRRLHARRGNRQTVLPVTVNGRRFKRVICADTHRARAMADTLERLGPNPHVPTLIATVGREVWVDYVAGRPFRPEDGGALTRIYDLYAALYRHAPRAVSPDESVHHQRLCRDLWVLREVGALDDAAHAEIAARAAALKPARLWLGFDYADARIDNFLWAENDLAVGIDVENFSAETPLGLGLASARLYWAGAHGPDFAGQMAAAGLHEIAEALPYLDLMYRAGLLKRRILKRKRGPGPDDPRGFLAAQD